MNIIVTNQIHLSEIRPGDKTVYIEHLREKEIYERTLRLPYPYTETDADEWIARVEKETREQGQPASWAIRNEEGYLIGGCGFGDLTLGKSHRAELGYWLAKPFWGRAS